MGSIIDETSAIPHLAQSSPGAPCEKCSIADFDVRILAFSKTESNIRVRRHSEFENNIRPATYREVSLHKSAKDVDICSSQVLLKRLCECQKIVIKLLKKRGWRQVRMKGSHRQFKHPKIAGVVTIPGKLGDNLAPGTLNSIYKQAGWK